MESVIALGAAAPGGSTLLEVEDHSQIGGARRSAVALGNSHGLSEDAVGRLAIVVTEAATNIVRHAERGIMVIRALVAGSTPAIEILALDKGPGIPEVERAMRDGYSTSGTPGQGLGGMQRLADVFEIHSQRGTGTAVLARIGERPRLSSRAARTMSVDDRIGAVCVPLRGETECGDAWRVIVGRRGLSVMLVDGLGHGPEAAQAAAAATNAFAKTASARPEEALAALDAAMHGTRGAALSVVMIDDAARTTRFSGVGNVDGRVLSDGPTEHLVPQNGIAGCKMPLLKVMDTAWPIGARLVLHSDGIAPRWRMDSYPGLKTAHPGLVAGIIYRDFARDRDDVTILVVSDVAGAKTE